MRIVVAMSGGVDSSAAAALLKEQGHEVIGMTLRVWSYESQAQCGSCCSPDDIDDARRVAEALDIPFYVAGVEELFKEQVVQPFVRDYLQGRTPIPCVACNRDVKFNFLLRRARALGAKLATGHYARVETRDGVHRLFCGEDVAKDQSYFLFTLGQDELSDLIFPVGHLSKPEVRAIAERHGLTTSSKPESMEICFVPNGDHGAFVEKVAGPQPGGDVVDARGRVLGRHTGVHRYTVGQRRGLNLGGSPVPLYVQRVDAERREVVVGPVEDLSCTGFDVIGSRWVSSPPPEDQTVRVRIRHRHGGAEARIRVGTSGRSHVELLEPARAVTPGQAAVFYRGDEVLGGGWIA